ncbi:MAG: pilus assembly PilX N-terminal domain-containing protein [Patescibacteria group bacterium]|nr:pilus assembly PilX N-terminal domain-containing protein [Patescibacteria group bacterium]
MKIRIKVKTSGSALMLTLFILSAVMLIVIGGATTIAAGLRMGTIQAQSTRAYFAAEAGAEKLLYEVRQGGNFTDLSHPGEQNIFGTTTLSIGAGYIVNYDSFPPFVFTSIGHYRGTQRSVELDF